MAETKFNGYVIAIKDYQIFDHIVTILSSNGQKIVCLSCGSKRIISKNARNLVIGNFCECICFLARHENKISRLKKIIALNPVSWNLTNNESFNVLNELSNNFEDIDKKYFDFYKQMLSLIKNNLELNDKIKTIIILKHFFDLSGISLHIKSCVICNNNKIKTISLKEHGMICKLCFDPKRHHLFPVIISKIFYWIWTEEFNQLQNYQNELNFILKLLKQFLNDELGIKLKSLNQY